MRAAVVDRLMEPGELEIREIDAPVPGPDALAIEVRAAGCNFFDLLLLQGRYQVKPPLPFVPGAEVAGTVRALGPGVAGFAVGDRVFAASGLGGFAEVALAPARGAWRMPEGMSFEEGASLPIIYPTAWAGLVLRAGLRKGEVLLVHAAAGGVGIAAVQIGKALGAFVIATAGGAQKLAFARAHGADETIDYQKDDFAARVLELTGGAGADVIYDPVGGDVFDASLRCIAWSGRLLVIGFASGRIPEIRANRILLKNIAVTGLHWGAYAAREPARAQETMEAVLDLYRAGGIRPAIGARYSLDELPAALQALGSRRTTGKVVVAP